VDETIQCPGCAKTIDVTRPSDTNVEIARSQTDDHRPVVAIMIGRVETHRCQMFPDGAWR
jgi:hypothetical protein